MTELIHSLNDLSWPGAVALVGLAAAAALMFDSLFRRG